MSNQIVSIEQMADVIMEGLQEYADLATDDMKKAVKKAGNTVKTQINATAPKRTGKYAKSWKAKNTRETSTELQVTVYSPTRYMLAHLLENGHAKRGGGRVKAIPHIAPAEAVGEEQLIKDIESALGK